MPLSKKQLAKSFALAKIYGHATDNMIPSSCCNLFRQSEVSCYLIGNPLKLKTFVGDYVELPAGTSFNKHHRLLWCIPTQFFFDEYVTPKILKKAKKRHKK